MTRTLRRQLRTVKYVALIITVSIALALVILESISRLPEQEPVQLNDRQQAAYEQAMQNK